MSRRGSSRPPAGAGADEKTCAGCGRRVQWRRKWAQDWDEIRWCSQACRRRGRTSADGQLETAILELLSARAAASTICPSEAARRVAAARQADGPDTDRDTAHNSGHDSGDRPGQDSEPWRQLMEPARAAARRLVAAGEVEIIQKGRAVDPSTAKGPIRLRRGAQWTGRPSQATG